MEQEHKDQIMIQKSLVGAVDPEEQQEVDQIGCQHNAKNKGEVIQMTPLLYKNKEYERASRVARDMDELYKKAMTTSKVLNEKFTRTQAEKEELSEKCRQTEEKLKEAKEELLKRQHQLYFSTRSKN